MATERYEYCPKCKSRTTSRHRLFDRLLKISNDDYNCATCGGRTDLWLIPPFALGAGGKSFVVLDVFSGRRRWKNNGKAIIFHPFLVVLEDTKSRNKTVWLPYWHTDGSRLKYGERAPWMDADLFCGLIEQAQAKGYFIGPISA